LAKIWFSSTFVFRIQEIFKNNIKHLNIRKFLNYLKIHNNLCDYVVRSILRPNIGIKLFLRVDLGKYCGKMLENEEWSSNIVDEVFHISLPNLLFKCDTNQIDTLFITDEDMSVRYFDGDFGYVCISFLTQKIHMAARKKINYIENLKNICKCLDNLFYYFPKELITMMLEYMNRYFILDLLITGKIDYLEEMPEKLFK
jgi:hypothetical protein